MSIPEQTFDAHVDAGKAIQNKSGYSLMRIQVFSPSRGQTGPHGEPLEPDAESEIEIISVTDEAGNECDPETIENINSLCWDHFLKIQKDELR